MKYKLLSVNNGPVQNIGDYIQALAASQFLPTIDGFINREELDTYNDEESVVIMNGWFMHNPSKWPPSSKIKPLFISFHVNESSKEKLLTNDGVNYLKSHEPIGCRDYHTVKTLTDAGINAYFSGCLTLTLGNTFSVDSHDGGYYFVDPMIPRSQDFISRCKDVASLFFHFKDVLDLSNRFQITSNKIRNLFLNARFYRCYTAIFEREIVMKGTYITQQSLYYGSQLKTDHDKLKEAERLVKLYANAQMVVTSRIHCALPCLGLSTPVCFVKKEDDSFISACRFDGLLDLFNVVLCSDKQLKKNFETTGLLGRNNMLRNKDTWKDISSKLSNTCTAFVNSFK